MNSQLYQTTQLAYSRLFGQILPSAFAIFRPPPELTTSQWADRNRILGTEHAESGQWHTSKAEYQRDIMDAAHDRAVDQVTVMKSSRSGVTQALVDNTIGYIVDQDPGPILLVEPGLKEAREWSKDHLDEMVRNTPCLWNKISVGRSKDKSNELLHKNFPGGVLIIVGANSAKSFRFRTARYAILDDVDGMPLSVQGEGDVIALSFKRTQSFFFHGRKVLLNSSPTIRDLSIIEREYFKSDQGHYYVNCPLCDHPQILIFSQKDSQFKDLAGGELKFDTANISWVYYDCENCHGKIGERYQVPMVRNGKWKKLKPEIVHHRGFHVSDMISPFTTWTRMVEEFLAAKMSVESLRVFVNQSCGESFIENKTLDIKDEQLRARIEDYPSQVPNGVLVLTSGTDVQPDRLITLIVGWGKGFENWHIDHREIIGSPDRDDTWKKHDEFLATVWKHESGLDLEPWMYNGLNAVCVDSGYSAQNVYRYIRKRQSRPFFATKGDEGMRLPFVKEIHYRNAIHARLAIIGVDSIKTRIYDCLSRDRNKETGDFPPGYMHFDNKCNQAFFDQLNSEKRVMIRNPRTGKVRFGWKIKEGRENHILDCYALNWAAITTLNPTHGTVYFENMEARLSEKLADREAAKSGGELPGAPPTSRREAELARRPKSSWMKGYK
jgi:phage terminase large subunit GpA-like protein